MLAQLVWCLDFIVWVQILYNWLGFFTSWEETDPYWVEAYSRADYDVANTGDVPQMFMHGNPLLPTLNMFGWFSGHFKCEPSSLHQVYIGKFLSCCIQDHMSVSN